MLLPPANARDRAFSRAPASERKSMPVKAMRVKSVGPVGHNNNNSLNDDGSDIFRADVGYFRDLRLIPRSFKVYI